MTRFVPLSSAAALMLALAGCGAEPAQESAATPDQSEVPAGEAPTMVETMPAAEAAATAADPAEATEVTRPPEKSRPKQEPKVAAPPRAKAMPEAVKPADPEPDPHAGPDMRSEERRVGKECVSQGGARWCASQQKKKNH